MVTTIHNKNCAKKMKSGTFLHRFPKKMCIKKGGYFSSVS